MLERKLQATLADTVATTLAETSEELRICNEKLRFLMEQIEETKKEMLSNQKRYRKLFNSLTEPIFVTDADTGMIEDANTSAQELVGRTFEELLCMHQSQLHPPELSEAVKQQFAQDSEASKRPDRKEFLVRHSDGRNIPVEISSGGRYQEDSRFYHVGIFSDITERKRIEEELLEAKREAEFATIFDGVSVYNPSYSRHRHDCRGIAGRL